jgi:hypothetical protein
VSGKIIADIIEASAGRISLNVANVTVASINASGLYTSTGNLIISQANQIGTAAIVDGAVTDVKIEDGAVTNAKLTLAANASNIKTALNASGDAAIYAARAWVNVKGDDTPPTVRGSGNVSSVTRGSTGVFTVNFTTAMPDTNYVTNSSSNFNNLNCMSFPGTRNTTSITVSYVNIGTESGANPNTLLVSVFR